MFHDVEPKGRDALILLFVVIITFNTQIQDEVDEHMPTSNEAIADLAAAYSSGNATLTNLHITGNLTCDGNIITPIITLGENAIRNGGERLVFKNSNQYPACCGNPELNPGEFSVGVTSDNNLRWWSMSSGRQRGRVGADAGSW